MSKVNGYKCDFCGKITEEAQFVVKSYGSSFSVEKTSYIESYRDTACSVECIKNALDLWIDMLTRKEAEEAQAKAEAKARIEKAEAQEAASIAEKMLGLGQEEREAVTNVDLAIISTLAVPKAETIAEEVVR